MIVSRHQNVGQNKVLLINNKFFENVEKFKYFGTTVTKLHPRRNEEQAKFEVMFAIILFRICLPVSSLKTLILKPVKP
jgi:hypothetical protein